MINQVHTNCKDCAFSVYSDKTQTGCSAGMLDKYKDAGAEVIEVYDDSDKEFFVINNKLCTHHRDKEWAKQYTKSELLNIVESQTKSPYQVMLLFHQDSTLDDLSTTLESLVGQFNPPSIISVISMKKTDSIYKLNMQIEDLLKKHEDKVDWRIQNILDVETTDRQAIDLAVDGTYFKYTFPYYIVFSCGFQVPEEFTEEIHNSIIIDAKQPVYCHPVDESLNGMLVNRLLHRKHTGNAFNVHIEDKLLEFEEDAENYIYKIEDICPSMAQK